MKSIPAAMIFGGGEGGGSGSGSYTDLTHKPSINDVELSGNKSLSDLGLYSKTEVDDLLDDKADASTTYTKTEVDALIPDISGKADKSTTYTKTETDDLLDDKADSNSVNQNWQGNGYNLFKFPYAVMDYAKNGVHYVANSDGSIDISGEATDTSDFDFISYREEIMLPKGKYMVLCEETSTNKHMQVNLYDGNTYKSTIREGVGEFEITQSIIDTGYVLRIYYRCSVSRFVDTAKIHPMLVKVNDDGTYPTEYQRYAMGNSELTDKVSNIQEPTVTWENCTPLSEGTSFQAKNGVAYLSAHLNNVSITANTWKSFGTIPEGFRPNKPDIRFPVLIDGTTKACKGHITSTGVIGIYSSEAITESSSAFVFNLSYIIN